MPTTIPARPRALPLSEAVQMGGASARALVSVIFDAVGGLPKTQYLFQNRTLISSTEC